MLNSKNFLPLVIAANAVDRDSLYGLHVTPEYTEATDSYRLIRVSRKEFKTSELPSALNPVRYPNYTLPYATAKKVSGAIPKKASEDIYLNAIEVAPPSLGKVSLTVVDKETSETYTADIAKEKFPEIDKVIPQDSEIKAEFRINVEYLAEILEQCKKFGSEHADVKVFNGSRQAIKIDAANKVDGQTFMALIMPVVV